MAKILKTMDISSKCLYIPLNGHTPWQVLFQMQEIPITFQGHVVVNDVPSLIKDTNLRKSLLMLVSFRPVLLLARREINT